jgi:hypothetical protein
VRTLARPIEVFYVHCAHALKKFLEAYGAQSSRGTVFHHPKLLLNYDYLFFDFREEWGKEGKINKDISIKAQNFSSVLHQT